MYNKLSQIGRAQRVLRGTSYQVRKVFTGYFPWLCPQFFGNVPSPLPTCTVMSKALRIFELYKKECETLFSSSSHRQRHALLFLPHFNTLSPLLFLFFLLAGAGLDCPHSLFGGTFISVCVCVFNQIGFS